MKSAQIRQLFLDYFQRQGHQVVDSSSLVPANDATLLFTNAGMVQFKDVFLGAEQRPYQRATSSQRCVRAGGKHNDLENVGYTARHHTFFEMLGNFSFGDYFKRDAIAFAWQFLTQELGLPAEKLWVTVHVSDDEAADIWLKEMGVSAERFSRLDEDNFWSMGDTGPCGPSSEIFYDHGADVAGGPPGSPDDDGDRYIEIWNLVFMQFERNAAGEMKALPNPSIDTGMGLERVAAVMQGVHSNYEIDLFQALIAEAARLTGTQDLRSQSLRVIADHIRSCSFLIADSVVPSNEGRGYVLRRIIRRAVRHGNKLGAAPGFFHQLVASLVAQMGEAYPELVRQQGVIERVLKQEEEQFARTLEHGMGLLTKALAGCSGGQLAGETIFKLYDTYGFPVDLTADVAREQGVTLDQVGFDAQMQAQKARARAASNFKAEAHSELALEGATEFTGYSDLAWASKLEQIIKDGQPATELVAGEQGILILAQTPFYGESGGQVGDKGFIFSQDANFEVQDCQKQGDLHLHYGRMLHGSLRPGQAVDALVDEEQRLATARHHSATHLLHAALRQVLGEQVQQKGSLVDHQRLRFDFTHFEAISAEQLQQIEALVSEQIVANTPVSTELMAMDEAKQAGAMALFGEKYGDEVRVLSMGQDRFSVELCGGTHVQRTGDIGAFKILAEAGIAAGVRRIEAVAGLVAQQQWQLERRQLLATAALLKAAPEELQDKVTQLGSKARDLEKLVAHLQQQLANQEAGSLLAAVQQHAGVSLLVSPVNTDAKALKGLLDELKAKLGSGVIVLAAVSDRSVQLAVGVTDDLTGRIKAGDLVRQLAPLVDGKGGGKADTAMAGGQSPEKLELALAQVPGLVTALLG